MPIFFQQQLNETTRLGIWKIEETEDFFKDNVPQHRDVTHPHKRLQHLAGRFLLRFLFPAFPHELIQIADTNKPFLPDEQYHFSISHCGDYAAAIVSSDKRVGIDIEIPVDKILRIRDKFLSPNEKKMLNGSELQTTTLRWSAKEAVFKWYGKGAVDFREHIHIRGINNGTQSIECQFAKTNTELSVHFRLLDQLVLAWTLS